MARLNILAEVTGNVWKIQAKPGDQLVEEGVIMILESMKMEIPVESPCDATLVEILVKEEEAVMEDQIIAVIET